MHNGIIMLLFDKSVIIKTVKSVIGIVRMLNF